MKVAEGYKLGSPRCQTSDVRGRIDRGDYIRIPRGMHASHLNTGSHDGAHDEQGVSWEDDDPRARQGITAPE